MIDDNKWFDIKNYEGLYKINKEGQILSLKNNKIRKNIIFKGYYRCGLCKNGIQKYYFIHRLLGDCFIENKNNFPVINHKNGIKNDNRLENLEWCSISYNTKHNYDILGYKISDETKNKMSLSSKKRKIVYQYDLNGCFINEWDSSNKVEKILNIPRSNICNVCNGKYKSAGGYIWSYIKK